MQRIEFMEECENNVDYLSEVDYAVDCNIEYHHYNSSAYRYDYSPDSSDVNIGTWNLFHPGTSKAAYKDYELVAKIMDHWDVITVVELLPLIGSQSRKNDSVLAFIEEAPREIKDYKKRLGRLNPGTKKYEETKERYDRYVDDYEKAQTMYSAPGYLRVLTELRKLDETWSLIISPMAEGSEGDNTKELVGFYYRASKVRPVNNDHCDEFSQRNSRKNFACFPELTKRFLRKKDYSNIFARRPFMASFESGNFDFTLLGAHVIHNSPDGERRSEIMNTVFGIEDYNDLDEGIEGMTYARYAEVKATMDFITQLKKSYDEQDVIYTGDYNIEIGWPYLEEMMKPYSNYEILIEEPTSLANSRYVQGYDSGGYSRNYDHFFVDKIHSNECGDAERVDFYSGMINDYMRGSYLIRDIEDITYIDSTYDISSQGKRLVQRSVSKYRKYLESKMVVKRNKVVPMYRDIDEMVDTYKRRVFQNQLDDTYFYGVYKEVLSDHAPIYMSCDTSVDDD